MKLNEENAKELEHAMRGWDLPYKARVRECQNQLRAALVGTGACAMGAVWAVTSQLGLDEKVHPLWLYRVPWWAWLTGFTVVGVFTFCLVVPLLLGSLERAIRAAHQDGLRLFMKRAKELGIRLSRNDVMQMLSVADYYLP